MMSQATDIPATPLLPERPERVVRHGHVRIDPYAWVARAGDAALRPFLRASNRHARQVLQPAGRVMRRLTAELRALTPPLEGAPPFRCGRHVYHFRHLAAHEYPQVVRWPAGSPQQVEMVLDVNALAARHRFCAVAQVALAPDERYLAYTIDTCGARRYSIRIRDVRTGRDLPDVLRNTDGTVAWRSDGRAVLYTLLDPVNQRPCIVRLHEVGRPVGSDATVYVESDDTFRCLVAPTTSGQYIRIVCFSGDTEDVLLLRAAQPAAPPLRVAPRVPGRIYEVDHGGGPLIIRTNRRPDFAVYAAARPGVPERQWRDIARPYAGVFVERIYAFRRHVLLVERRRAAVRIRCLCLRSGRARVLPVPPTVGVAWVKPVPGMSGAVARIGCTSLVTPVSYYDCHLASGRLRLVQQEQIPGYVARDYVTWRGWAPARDGARIPFTAVRRRGPRMAGGQPVLLFAYGAYGTNIPPWFDQARLPLLDRGFLYVMVHVRGGSELGCAWYHKGRKHNAAVSARDLQDCAAHLVATGVAAPDMLCVETLSAGGITVGHAVNTQPGLFRGIIAQAPFVDPLTSIADPTVPLTLSEYEEWGDPARHDDWRAMCAYAPYDNIRPQAYPAMLVTTNVYDSNVPFWEPVKWVARLRRANQGQQPILLVTRRNADHDGPSGRSRRLRERAFEWAFLLHVIGRADDT
jgi:oligopeptidase B